jgi:NarL family two-component system response regulator LiaR
VKDRIRVLVVDDHLVVRQGVRALLATEPDIDVVGEASNGTEAVAQAARLAPDVILMDLIMPEMDGIQATQQILVSHPEAHILVLTSFDADDKVFPALRAGAAGYTLKNSGPDELLYAIRRVHAGESSLHPAIARKVLQELAHHPSTPQATTPLTEREVEILRLVAHGDSNQQIAAELRIGEATVRTHVSNILTKLHLASRTQAALFALREGIASLYDEYETQ